MTRVAHPPSAVQHSSTKTDSPPSGRRGGDRPGRGTRSCKTRRGNGKRRRRRRRLQGPGRPSGLSIPAGLKVHTGSAAQTHRAAGVGRILSFTIFHLTPLGAICSLPPPLVAVLSAARNRAMVAGVGCPGGAESVDITERGSTCAVVPGRTVAAFVGLMPLSPLVPSGWAARSGSPRGRRWKGSGRSRRWSPAGCSRPPPGGCRKTSPAAAPAGTGGYPGRGSSTTTRTRTTKSTTARRRPPPTPPAGSTSTGSTPAPVTTSASWPGRAGA